MTRASALCVVVAFLLAATTFAAPSASLLHQAADTGDVELVARLLASGADLDHSDAAGMTPLQIAIARRHNDIALLLLARGADATTRDDAGRTPLHRAAEADDKHLIDALLLGGADLDAADERGDTPLHRAARFFRLGALRQLLDAGAAVNVENRAGQTPLDVLGSHARDDSGEFEQARQALGDVLRGLGALPGSGRPQGTAASRDVAQPQQQTRDDYRTYQEIETILHNYAANYPNLCMVHDIGLSVQGRHLWALQISDNVGVEEDEPEFKYVSTMHGDETVGNEMCLFLIDLLIGEYGTNPRITNIVDEMDIWIMPLMNPDGYVLVRRNNVNGVNLNRNFPEGSDGDPNTTTGREPETAAVMEWTWANSFTQSANLHTGALVVNYPFDDDNRGSVFSPSPDEDLFVYISEAYSIHNVPMWNGSWYHGITNGAAWYSISGGMQDWHYRYEGCNEVTLELSNTKNPPYYTIPGYWDDNRESMLSYMEQCLIGVRGIVTDAMTGDPLYATIRVVDRDHDIYTDPQVGDYHRMLLPGTYDLEFEAQGYETRVIRDVEVYAGDATRLDVQLSPPPEVTYPNGGEELTAGSPATVTWESVANVPFQVQYTSNYGDVAETPEGFEGGVIPAEFTLGGNADWFATTDSVHSGTYAARAGDITHNQVTWMTRTVSGGTLSFWYRVSSESNYDFFNFYIDDVQHVHRSGNVGWMQFHMNLSPGQHELKWEYDKDYSVDGGSDTAWVDDITITVDNTTWEDIVSLTDPGVNDVQWTPLTPGEDYKVRVRANYGEGDWGLWDESDGTFSVVEGAYALGDVNCDGVVNNFDIDPFVLALTDPDAYVAQYPNCDMNLADVNGDGAVNNFDIDSFVALLTGK